MSQASSKRKTASLRDQLAAVAEHRKELENGAAPRGGSPPSDAPARYLHTTVHITEEQLVELRAEASRRLAMRECTRMDVSAVMRDLVDFWRTNEAAFRTWRLSRPR